MGWVSDQLHDVQPHAYADADFAGCTRTLRSTSGAQIQIEGPNTRFPLYARSVRQQAVAHSTLDAELATINMLFRMMMVPAMDMWSCLSPLPIICFVHEENSACISVICSGKNPTMRHIGRTQGINIQMLHEFVGMINSDAPCALVKTESADMVADIHTKGFTNAEEWIEIAICFIYVILLKLLPIIVSILLNNNAVPHSNKLMRPFIFWNRMIICHNLMLKLLVKQLRYHFNLILANASPAVLYLSEI